MTLIKINPYIVSIVENGIEEKRVLNPLLDSKIIDYIQKNDINIGTDLTKPFKK